MHGKQPSVIFRGLLLLGATVAFSATVHAQSTMPPEELAVRTAYARITFGAESAAVYDLAMQHLVAPPNSVAETFDATALQLRLQTGQPQFALSSMKIGDVSEIADRPLGELLTQDAGTVLHLQSQGASFNIDRAGYMQSGVLASWMPQSPLGFSWRTVTIGTLQDAKAPFTRHASYEVAATLNSESRTTKALVLFRADGEVGAMDTMLDNGLIDYFKDSVYPHVLLEVPAVRAQPLVAKWLASHQAMDASCKADQQHLCFDPASGSVGVHPVDMVQSLAHPPAPKLFMAPAPAAPGVPMAIPQTVSQTKASDGLGGSCSAYTFTFPEVAPLSSDISQHPSSGSHSILGTVLGTCTYTDPPSNDISNCLAAAGVTTHPIMQEAPSSAPYLHINRPNPITTYGLGGGGATASTVGILTGSTLSCPLYLCGDLSSPLISIKSVVIWTPMVAVPIACGPQANPNFVQSVPPPGGGFPPPSFPAPTLAASKGMKAHAALWVRPAPPSSNPYRLAPSR